MIDYRPIADAMRHCKYKTTKAECESCFIHGICKNYKGFIEDYAADVVEHMQEELNAAIADIEHSCKSCKHGNSCDDYDCITDRVDNWEWRGLSLEKTSDKEVEKHE